MFPNITTEWWKDSPTETSPNKKTNCNDDSNGGDNDNATNLNITNNYGSIPSSSSYEPLINNRNIENKNDELFPTSLIEKCMDGICTTITTAPTTDGGYIDGDGFIRTYSNKSSITNDSGRSSVSGNGYSSDSSSVNNEGDDDSDDSSYSGEHDWKDDEELEAPHKTLGLLFFDTFRFIATMANFRLIMTEMVPLFLTRMPLLHVTLR